MKRRQFITLAGTAAIGTATLPSHSLPATQRSRWQPDGAGSLARIGVLTPDFDPVPESEMWAMAPQGVSFHASRLAYNRDNPRSFAEPPQVDVAAEQLAALNRRRFSMHSPAAATLLVLKQTALCGHDSRSEQEEFR